MEHARSDTAGNPGHPIIISGVAEPEEMQVEPFPTFMPTPPERMLNAAMKQYVAMPTQTRFCPREPHPR